MVTTTYTVDPFERYVNFEFYKTLDYKQAELTKFERYVNFEFYKTLSKLSGVTNCLRDM